VVIRRDFQGVWEGWKAGFLAFHPFHTLSFPRPALEARFTKSQSPRRPFENRNHLSEVPTIRQLALISFVDEWLGDLAKIDNRSG
jgi:hypothetical protein